MKFLQNKSFPKCLVLLCSVVLFSGCFTGKGAPPLLAPVVTHETVIETNHLTVTTYTTNEQNVVIPHPVDVPVYHTNDVTETNFVVSSGVQTALGALSTANTIAGPLNPFAGATTLMLTLLSGGLGLYAKLMSKRAQTHESIARTLVMAVEKSPEATGDVVKTMVADLSKDHGTSQAVHDFVAKVTG